MVDGALGALDLTLSKLDMIGFAPGVIHSGWSAFSRTFLKIFILWNFEI